MAKKLPLLAPPILTLTISTLAATAPKPASAAVWHDDTIWWSVAEMLDFYQEVEQEKADLCGSDAACTEEFNMTMIEKGNKYSVLENFLQGQFWITAINPKEETIKILYFDQEMMLRHMGIERKLTLKSFYLAWFDNWQGQIYNFYRPQFVSGEIEGLHTVYDSIAEGLDTAHLPAWHEIELSVPGTDLISNTSGKLDLAVFGTRGFNSMGYTDYSDCLNAPDYEEGMECKMMISGDKWISYFPPRAEIVEPDPEPVVDPNPTPIDESGSTTNPDPASTNESELITDPEPNIDLNPTPTVISEPIATEPTLLDGPGKCATTDKLLTITSVTETAQTTDTLPKAPDTGTEVYPGVAYGREIDMPWWIMVLIAAGISLLIWLFVPNRHNSSKNSQKSPKKCEKSLDKKTVMR